MNKSTMSFDEKDRRKVTIMDKRYKGSEIDKVFDNRSTIKKINRNEHILRVLDFGRYMSTDILIEQIKELDKIIPGRKEGYLLTKGKEEMFYSDIFVEDLLKKKFDKHLEERKDVV